MADILTVIASLLLVMGFIFLFSFIRRLGILEMEAAMTPNEVERSKPPPQPMIEVKNPFKMTIAHSSSPGFIEIIVGCMYPCKISSYSMVKKEYLNPAFSESEFNERVLILEENCGCVITKDFIDISGEKKLSYNIGEMYSWRQEMEEDIYDVVIGMELTDDMQLPTSAITAMFLGIELNEQHEKPQPNSVQQFIQIKNGHFFKLKKLFLENSSCDSSNEVQCSNTQDVDINLCIVCQMLQISRAVIPCGHACLCLLCFNKVSLCPMCREPIMSSFQLRDEPNVNVNNQYEFSDILQRMNPLEIIRGIYNAS